MKRTFTLLTMVTCLLSGATAFGQMDTLLFENFQTDPSDAMAVFPDPPDTDTMWVNFDFDQMPAANNFPSEWFWDIDWASPDSIPPQDSNFVFVSRSWLVNYDTSSSNWLITPAIEVVDDQATFHWKSAPFQGPRYMDGYSVVVMDDQSFFDANYVDVKFRAAENIGWIGNSGSTDPDSFLFSPGYVHASTYTDSLYFIAPGLDSLGQPAGTFNLGVLEPHSISLAEYAGQTIFIAIHHDSSDDNLLEVDDLLVLGTDPASVPTHTPDPLDLRFVTYPNPVDNYLNVLYRLKEPARTHLRILNQEGKTVRQLPEAQSPSGEYNHQLDLRDLPAGVYNVVLNVNGHNYSKTVVRR